MCQRFRLRMTQQVLYIVLALPMTLKCYEILIYIVPSTSFHASPTQLRSLAHTGI